MGFKAAVTELAPRGHLQYTRTPLPMKHIMVPRRGFPLGDRLDDSRPKLQAAVLKSLTLPEAGKWVCLELTFWR
ncbi:hypothetical protein NIES970_12700 [[Synechococcus] sp. NIES-970]|uniref:hypothetical protein n=1 Tax=Picosynechococcus sp. NKBG15041c TaxID=1407650 RepID=UPI000467475F|nr:hypothetical protein [Picosynechococcus sp. NKBG15041c]BAW96344.1 hypothetical protein NIES970_12700 [[Synechococcus] sp. NIES-970]